MTLFHPIKSKTLALALVWFLFTSTAPFEFYSVIPGHPYKYLAFYILALMLLHLARENFHLKSDIMVVVFVLQMVYTVFAIPQHIYAIPEFRIDDADIYFNLLIQLIVVYFSYIYVKHFIGIKVLGESFVYVMAFIQVLGSIVFIGGLVGFSEPI